MAQDWFWPAVAALVVTAAIATTMQVFGIKGKMLVALLVTILLTLAVAGIVAR